MLIYFLCLGFVVVAAYVGQRPGALLPLRSKLFAFATFVALVGVAGARAYSVGTDTSNYVYFFAYRTTWENLWSSSSLEPGWQLLTFFAQQISRDYWALLTLIALVAVFFYMRSIYKFSVDPVLSLFIFITMGYYTFFFNGARQGVACAIYTLSFGSLLDGNFKKYAFWVIVASLFHRTAIIALPLYFLFRQPTTLRYIVQMIVGASLAMVFLDTILDLGTLLSDKYIIYQELEASGGRLLTVFYVLLSLFFIFMRRNVADSDRKAYDYFLNMLVFGSTVYVIVILSDAYIELVRLAFYFQVSVVFLWPIVIKNIDTLQTRRALLSALVVAHLGYFYIFTNRMGDLVPYQFNSEIVRILGN